MAKAHKGQGEVTTDHDEIRAWIEVRGGRPSVVESTEGEKKGKRGGGILRVDFGDKDENLKEIPWEEFFDIFERNKLAFLHQYKTADGAMSRFNKFIARD